MNENISLKDYAHIHFMSAIISNADSIREITKTYNSAPKENRVDFEEIVSKIAHSYALFMVKVSNENKSL